MPLCQRCTSAIEEVYSQGHDHRCTKAVKIQLPVFSQYDVRSCWACLKFSKWLESEHPSLFGSWKTEMLGVEFSHHGSIVLSKRSNLPARLLVGIGLDKISDDDECCVLDLALIPPDDLAVQSGVVHSISPPGSFNLPLLKEWIDTCRKRHKQCNKETENWYPTRLLHITSGGQKVRLVISQDHAPKGQYITLSHRWGKIESTKLQTSNMAQLQRDVAVPDLPLAFQDAIKVAVSLEIQYLWIDALCIKQDEDERSDWEIESRIMGKVYANAFLNISATLAVDGSERLFHNQGYDALGLSEIKFKMRGKEKQISLLDGDIWTDEISNAPLNSRGWVFQGRFLAQRVLHFGTRQLGWECRQSTALEMFPRGLPASLGNAVSKASVHARLVRIARHTGRSSVGDWLTTWQDIVERYSQCLFTFGEDKLIAFAGIGASISSLVSTELVAGMLEKSLIYDLAWWRWAEDRELSPLRNTSFRAPSWSWMSVDGQINFPGDISGLKGVQTFLENIEIIRDHNDLYGTNSRLRLWGVCIPLKVEWSEEVIINFSFPALPECQFTVDGSPRGSSICCEIPMEQMRDLVQRSRILLLPLFSTPYYFNGILITSIQGRGLHRRIGAIEIPVMEESAHVSKRENVREDNQMELWLRDIRETETGFTRFYNYTALRLIEYIQSSACRNIEIS
ncbi:heterokaryon incompatibility protein-domain-containing protein [Cadophora sp. MPI-SDFR-AT-0126]|nr:heterokaryon incompatibility protein-domain-containing protein [Leotiomycetes sp. MPI-SDFR-AT-0126]